MKKKIILLSLLIIVKSQLVDKANVSLIYTIDNQLFHDNIIQEIYDSLTPANKKPPFESFYNGLSGYFKIQKKGWIHNQRFLSIIDFSMSSTQERMWIIDIYTHKIIFNTWVAHGKNSGEEYAVNFSDRPKSNMSSLGFYLTDEIYTGKHGLSLSLDGLEYGINGNAKARAIVIHPANYVSEDYIKKNNRLGRSFGCPALSPDISEKIIQTIKGGSLLFIYRNDQFYFTNSEFVKYRNKNLST